MKFFPIITCCWFHLDYRCDSSFNCMNSKYLLRSYNKMLSIIKRVFAIFSVSPTRNYFKIVNDVSRIESKSIKEISCIKTKPRRLITYVKKHMAYIFFFFLTILRNSLMFFADKITCFQSKWEQWISADKHVLCFHFSLFSFLVHRSLIKQGNWKAMKISEKDLILDK